MNARIISSLFAAIFVIASAMPSFAQAKIDKLVSKIEGNPKVNVTYTEKRDPETHKIVKQNLMLSGNDKTTADALWTAFEDERQNSVNVTKTRNQSFIIKFIDKGMTSSYVLSLSGEDRSVWSLVISKRPTGDGSNDLSFNELDFSEFERFNEFDKFSEFERFNEFDKFSEFERFNEFDKFSEFEKFNEFGKQGSFTGNVKVYDKDGKLIYDNSDDKSGKTSKSTSTSTGNRTKTVTTTTVNGKTYQTISYM